MFLQEAERFILPIARYAFLLGIHELSSPMNSTQKINMTLAAQTIYLEKVQKILKDDLTDTKSTIKGGGNVDTILEKQLKRLVGYSRFFQKCIVLLKTEPMPTDYELNLIKSKAEK